MRVSVLGKGQPAIDVCKWFLDSWSTYTLDAVVPSNPEPTWTPSLKAWAMERQIPIFKDTLGVPQSDLVVSVYYSHRIKYIDRHLKVINIHNGPLPRYRGCNPVNWALENKEREHGVTIHEVAEGFDEGPIYGQVKFSIWPEVDEVEDVYQRCLKYGWQLFMDTMEVLWDIEPIEQDHSKAIYYKREDVEKLKVRKDWVRDGQEKA